MHTNKTEFSNFITGVYQRNKSILIISVAIFFIPFFLGILMGYFLPGLTEYLLTEYVKLIQSLPLEMTTSYIFTHNLGAALLTYIGGVIGIIPVGTLSFNGFFIGSFIGYLTRGSILSSFGTLSATEFIAYTLPHAIFEIPGFIISGAAGFRVTTLVIGIIRSMKNKTPINEHYWKFKDSLILLLIAIILLFIAAFIEANLTIPIGNSITGLNLHYS